MSHTKLRPGEKQLAGADRNTIVELQNEIAMLNRRVRTLEMRLEELELYNFQRRSLRDKFRPQLWNYRQHPPRTLKVPESYHAQRIPARPPRIAIVTPSLNHSHFIRSTIDSVLDQGYPNLNYCVQDGGSTDDTQSLLAQYGDRLQWRSEQDGGQADAINRGFASVSGDIMGFLNSDDVLLPGALAYVADAFERNSHIDFVYSNRLTIDESGHEIGRIVLPPHDDTAIKWLDFIPQETMFWRRRVWDKIGPFDTTFRFALDWDFILRAAAAGMKFKRLPRFIACFRIHPVQKTIAMAAVGNDEQQKLRKTYTGRERTPHEIHRGAASYLRRHILFQRLYKLRLTDL